MCYAISSSYQGSCISVAFVLLDLTKIKACCINSVHLAYKTARLKHGEKPLFIKPHRALYVLLDEVEKELDKLEKNGVIVKPTDQTGQAQ